MISGVRVGFSTRPSDKANALRRDAIQKPINPTVL